MKKLLLFLFLNVSYVFIAQTGYVLTGLNLMPNTLTTRCDTAISVSFWAQTAANNAQSSYTLPFVITGNNFVPSQFQFNVSWGDGTSYQGNGGISTTGTVINLNPAPAHTYPGPGTYTVIASVFNFANQTVVVDSVVMTLGSCQMPIYSLVQVDCNNDGTIDSSLNNTPVPLILTGSGQTYTGSTAGNFYNFTGIEPGFYTLSVDPAWLTANNYTIGSIQGPPTLSTSAGAQTIVITLNCGNGGGNVSPMCVNGQVYCDQNGDGIYNGNDSPINNAPVTVNYGTGSVIVYTNLQGMYAANYMSVAGSSSTVSISSNWLTQHAYTANNTVDSIINLGCNAGAVPPTVFFPINCGANNGNPNCYSGYVFCDANNNNIMDAGELPLVSAPVILNATPNMNNINAVTVFTDSTGYFIYCGPLSNTNYVTATVDQSYLNYLGYTPNFGVITLITNQNGMLPINCGGGAGNGCADLWTTVTPWIGYYQNSTAYIKLNWGNYGPTASGNYTLSFTFPAGITVNTGSINTAGYTISGNTITWNLSNAWSGYSATDIITFTIPGGLTNGANHYFTSSINPTGNVQDCNQQNNNGNLLQILGNSYDPNDKLVAKPSIYNGSLFMVEAIETGVDDILTYTVRFQNTGTAPAQNIVVVDTLDAQLDFSSFYLVHSSHPVQIVDMGNGILHFEYNGIWLPDSNTNEPASHGQFTYRIQENTGNENGSEITNTAYIYFDWNAPIITNTTYNVNVWLEEVGEQTFAHEITPNPAQDQVTISVEGPFSATLQDLTGKVISSNHFNGTGDLDISALTSGVYLIRLEQAGKVQLVKIIKQ